MTTSVPDRRLTPARPDLAAEHLRGRVTAARFAPGVERRVSVPVAPLRREPRPDLGLDTELLLGEPFTVYDEDPEGWSWGQGGDGYVGWVPSEALGEAGPPATHKVSVLRTFLYPGPDIKLPPAAALPFAARVAVREVGERFAAVPGGYLWAGHLASLEAKAPDFTAVAERFVGVPYLWGGKSAFGLDCSALVQTALADAGIPAPRDSDMQECAVGRSVDPEGPFLRGDLVFWRGHVGVLRDPRTLLHANGRSMTVMVEPFAEARARIKDTTGADVTGVRRL